MVRVDQDGHIFGFDDAIEIGGAILCPECAVAIVVVGTASLAAAAIYDHRDQIHDAAVSLFSKSTGSSQSSNSSQSHSTQSQSTPATPKPPDDGNQGNKKTERGEQRAQQAREGDAHREVGDANRVKAEGRTYTDSETGNTVHVKGNRVVITDSEGNQVTQFKNTRANTAQRVQDGKWVPNK